MAIVILPGTPKRLTPDELKEKSFWDKCTLFRKEIGVPGFWANLEKNCIQWADDISVSPFWKAVKDRRPSWSNDFQRLNRGSLLTRSDIPPFTGKDMKRIREKICRQFIEGGKSVQKVWPEKGPPVPALNDLVRTRIECQFLDGVEYMGTVLGILAKEMGIEWQRTREGRLEGYFAQHFLFEQAVFFRFGGGQEPVTIKCEVQIATGLATQVWEMSHQIYEVSRIRSEQAEDWQWNPNDPRFIARQLGHMIHLADGLLVQLRDRSSSQKIVL
jgi:hypothetical protein